jgi:hypothetical protein
LSARVPTPASVLGHTPGDDFYLATYEDAVKDFHAMAAKSDRMKMFTIGKTTQGRDIEVGVISSPANLAHLDELKHDARRLATASDLTDEQAHKLAHETKAIVHINTTSYPSTSASPPRRWSCSSAVPHSIRCPASRARS